MSKLGLGQFDHINRIIAITVITLSGFHCIKKTYQNFNNTFVSFQIIQLILTVCCIPKD